MESTPTSIGSGLAGPPHRGLIAIVQRPWTVVKRKIDRNNLGGGGREHKRRRAALPGAAVLIISPILKYVKVLGETFGCLNLAQPFPNVLDAEFG